MCRHHNEGDAEYTHWESGEPNDDCLDGPPCICAAMRYSMGWTDDCCIDSNYISIHIK